jgi:tetratricopeptide (TPR) repeat protein
MKKTLQKANNRSVVRFFLILITLPFFMQTLSGCSLLPVKKHPQEGALSKKERENLAEALHLKGLTQYAEGHLEEAIETWLKEIELSPKRVRPYNNIGLTYRHLGKLDSAKQFHERAILTDPKFGHSYYSLGLVYYDRNDFDKAKELFLEAIKRGYFDADVYYSLGQANKNLKEYDEAIAAYEKTVKLYYAYRGAHYQLGECYRLQGKYDLARLEFKREINLNPSYGDLCKIGLEKIEAELDPTKDHGDLSMTVKQEKVAGFIVSGRDFIPGRSMDEIRRRLGNPVAEQIEARQSHAVQGQIDEIHTLDYDGLVIKIKRVNGAPPRDLLFGLTITDRRIVFKWGLKMGTPRNQVIHLFGRPREDGNSLTYATETGSVAFFFSKDLLEKVQWQWNID